MSECRCAPGNLSGQGGGEGGVKLGHFDKHFVKNTRDPAKHFGVFSPRHSKTIF